MDAPVRTTVVRALPHDVALSAMGVAHEIAGCLLIVFALLIIAVSGPRRRSRVFAILFAAAIVLVVVTGCAEPAAAAGPLAPERDVPGWLGGAALGAAVVGLGFGVALVRAALHFLVAAIGEVLHAMRIALSAAALLGLVVAILLATI